MTGFAAVLRKLPALAVLLLLGTASAWASNPFTQGMVTLTLDDGWDTQYTGARPALNQRGLKATYFLTTEGIKNGWGGYMTPAQVQTLLAEGNELAGHTLTHPDLTTLSATQLEAELRDSQAWIKSQYGLSAVPAFASPFGRYNPAVLGTIQQYYGSHRTVNGGHNFRDTNIYQLRAYDVTSSVSVETVRGWINQAIADKSWLILVFHEFTAGPTERSTQINIAHFEAILDHIQTTQVSTVSVTQGVAMMEGRTTEPTEYTAIYEDGLGDGFADWSWGVRNLNERTIVQAGLSSASFEPDNYGALYLHHASGLNASLYSYAELWVHGGTSGGQRVKLAFYDGSTLLGTAQQLHVVLGAPIQAGVWQKVTVPLSSMGITSGTIRDVYVQDVSGTDQGTLYVDSFRLIRSSTTPPPTPTTPPTIVYADALAPGFSDWSWATRNLDQRSIVHAGTSAISFEPDSWAGLYFRHGTGLDASKFSAVRLWVHGGTSGGQVVKLLLHNSSTTLGSIRLDTALGHPIKAGTWEQVTIPLSSMGISTGTIVKIYLQDASGVNQGTTYVDDIQLLPR